MFESVTNFFGGVGNFFRSGYNQASGFVHNVYDKVTGTTSNVAKTVYADIKSVVSGGGQIVEKTISSVVDAGKSVVVNAQNVVGNTISNTASSLSFPLVIGAGIFGFMMLNKR